jgi:glucose/mannose transport system permease protein
MDGASLPRIYWTVVLPSLRPVFFSAVMILAHIAIKSFDLVAAMTAGGPGYSSDLPAMFMYRSPSAAARWAWARPVRS